MEFITSWFTVNTRLQEIGDTQIHRIHKYGVGYTDTVRGYSSRYWKQDRVRGYWIQDTQIQLENTEGTVYS